MIQKQLTSYFKVKQGSILIGYYESRMHALLKIRV